MPPRKRLLYGLQTASSGQPPPPVITGPISSAGVFDSTGALVRTIWSAQVNDPRVNSLMTAWDGTLDDMSVAPTGNYTIKLLTNNVQYTWEGVVGNSSPDHSQTSVTVTPAVAPATIPVLNYYHAYESQIDDMCITDAGEMYFCTQYDERLNTMHVTHENNPQYGNGILGQFFRASFIGQTSCCTDGTNTYFAYNGFATNQSVVWAFSCSTHIPTVFSSADSTGSSFGYTYYYIGTYTSTGDSSEFIDDIAVQKSGSFLFISRPLLNTIYSLNKTTGAAAHTFTGFINPDAIECNPVTGDLWVSRRVDSATTDSTFDALNSTSQVILTNSNLTASVVALSGSSTVAYSTGSSAGKFYYEMIINSNGGVNFGLPVGVASTFGSHAFGIGFDAFTAGYYGDGTFNVNSVHTTGYPTFGNGDNVSIACDSVGSLIWFRVNGGNWNGNPAANPATGANGISIAGIGSTFYAAIAFVAGGTNESATAHFRSASWSFTAPTGFIQLPGINHIPTVSKLTVDGLGNMTAAGIDITGFQLPQAFNLAISPDGSTLLVADGGTVQQIKAFNTSDGSVKAAFGSSGTFGTLGGYANSPVVTNTKFMFSGFGGGSGGGGAWIAYSSNGSFWLADQGNFRYLHFSAGNSPTYIEQIAYIPSGTAWVCDNDDTRVFSFYHEFKIDYSKTLAPGNGSWALVNNWAANGTVPQFPDQYGSDRYAITGSNGRTYLPKPTGGSACTWYELTSTGYRNTGVVANFNYVDENFNLWQVPNVNPFFGPVVANYFFNPFTGFDGSNNPTWGDNPTLAPSRPFLSSVSLPANFPAITDPLDANNPSNATQRLQNGNIVVFAPESGDGNHLAGLNPATGAIAFMTHALVNSNFNTGNVGGQTTTLGPVPYFNNATHPGGFECHKAGATDFFTEFRGEDFGNNQTNVWSHWDQSGLLVNRWGVVAPYFGIFQTTTENPPIVSAATLPHINTLLNGVSSIPQRASGNFSFMGEPGMAGNAAWGGIAFQNGNYYLYHSDEFYHGGIHRWKVSNLVTKNVVSLPVSWNSSSYVPPSKVAYRFMSALPFNQTNLPNNSAGWTRNPTGDIGTPGGSTPFYRVLTNAKTPDPHLDPDILFECFFQTTFTTAFVSYNWTRVGTGNWSISGAVLWNGEGSQNGSGDPLGGAFIDILDNTGKIIVRMGNVGDLFTGDTMIINDTHNISGPWDQNGGVWGPWINQIQPLVITANVLAGTVTVSYAGFSLGGLTVRDAGADITHPAQFRLIYASTRIGGPNCSITLMPFTFADM